LFLERSLGRGGAQRQLVALALGLARRGHVVTVALFYDEGPLTRDLFESGVQVQILGKKGRWDIVSFIRRVLRLLEVNRPDVLCTFLPVPNLIAACCKVVRPALRVAWGIRASDMDLRRYDRLTRLSYKLEVLGSRMANVIISNSQSGMKAALAKGFPAHKVVVVANGIDADRFHFDSCGRRRLRQMWNVAEKEILVGLIARLDPMKGHRAFIRAAANVAIDHPNVRFLCVGDQQTILREELVAFAETAGLASRMIWSAGRDDMPAVFSACDVVCSSSAFGEGFSNTLAEAMACGRRCVATDVGDVREIIADTGCIVSLEDDKALAGGLAQLCQQVKNEGEFSVAARERILKNFSIDRMVSAFEDHFKRLLS
jgi:glycosyltransferase involved in cell wall biosynthesis